MTYSFSKLKISKSGFSIDVYRNVSSNRKFYDSSFHSTKLKISDILQDIYNNCSITRDKIFIETEEDFKDKTEDLIPFLKDLFLDLELYPDLELELDPDLNPDLDDLEMVRAAIKFLEKIGKKTVWKTVSENGFDDYHNYSWTRKEAVEHVRDYVC